MSDTSETFDPSSFLTLYREDTDAEPASGWVTYLQQRLQDKGFDPGPIDGIFGPRTEAAVKEAQTWAGIRVDGIVGNATWGALHDAFGLKRVMISTYQAVSGAGSAGIDELNSQTAQLAQGKKIDQAGPTFSAQIAASFVPRA